MPGLHSTVLAVTDLSPASYRLVAFAAVVAAPSDGEVLLISAYNGGRGLAAEAEASESRSSRPPLGEAELRLEGQLLEQQRQWCADKGVRCRAELYDHHIWPEFVLQSAAQAGADLIMVGIRLLFGSTGFSEQLRALSERAPCPVSLVQLPTIASPIWAPLDRNTGVA